MARQTQSVGANATGYTATGLKQRHRIRISRIRQERLRQWRGGYHHRQAGDNARRARQLARRIRRQRHNPAMGFGNGAQTGGEPVTAYIIRHGAKAATVGAINSAVIGSLTNGETIAFSHLCRKCGGRERRARDNQRIRQHNARRANGFASARRQRRYNPAMDSAKR